MIQPYLLMDFDGREGSLFAVGAQLRTIDAVCQRHGTTFILLHHATAAAARSTDPPSLHDAAWSGFAAFFRQWIVLRHREDFDPETGTSRLWMRSGGSAGHYDLHGLTVREGRRDDLSGRVWDVTLERMSDVRANSDDRKAKDKAAKLKQQEAEHLEADRKAIVRALVRLDRPETKTDLRDRAHITKAARFNVALEDLIEDDTVTTFDIVKANKQHYLGYGLKEWQTRQIETATNELANTRDTRDTGVNTVCPD